MYTLVSRARIIKETMCRLASNLEEAGIPYALMAACTQGARQIKGDIEFLTTGEGLERIRMILANKVYKPVQRHPRRFLDPITDITITANITGHYPGIRGPGEIPFPDPGGVRERIGGLWVVQLPPLIELKLAAHRFFDSADVVSLIEVHHLDESFAAKLHPSMHADYHRCLDEKRRQDEFDARD